MAPKRILRDPGPKWTPAALKKLGYKRAGPKSGPRTFVLPKGKTPPKPKPPAPAIPYSEYAAYPFAQRQMAEIDRAQKSHQDYVGGTVAPWLAASLKGLTGVDPAQPGLNAQAQQQFLANVQGQVGGALNAAATATPMAPGATTPGGLVQGNNAFLGQAASLAASQRSSAALQSAQMQSQLSTLVPNTQAQGAVRQLADIQAGLPLLYAQRRNDQRNKTDQFIMEFEESNRRARVQEGISAWNAQTNAAYQAAQLGLDASEMAADSTAAAVEAGTPVPEGVIRLPDGSYRNDPTYQAPGGSGGGGGNKPLSAASISSMNGKWQRPRNSPPKLGAGWKQPVWDPGTKAWYAKRAAGAGSTPKAPKVVGFGTLVSDIGKQWNGSGSGPFGSGTPGWSEALRGNQAGIADALSGWVIENASSFNTAAGGKFNIPMLKRVLATLGDGNRKYQIIAGLLAPRIKNGKLT